MIATEKKRSEKSARFRTVEADIAKRYQVAFCSGEDKCYVQGQHFFIISEVDWEGGALIIEHADNEEDARKGLFEDGDVHYYDSYTEEDLIRAVIDEIEAGNIDGNK